ncbi:hypothetical protein IFM89_039109 [Coptis chinensis]|uniref:Pentatricopeptide repeat-containing protein n=1 Tax=Coptis chinensis TaxID=261450 RepID=A0A835M3M1_9MAGN|nr:hypothetical protein IFM89_039109 [Coptis chinensis]
MDFAQICLKDACENGFRWSVQRKENGQSIDVTRRWWKWTNSFHHTILIDEMLKECQTMEGFQEMISSGLKPDVCTYTLFIHTLCSNGKLEQAEDLMIQMNREGIRPNLVTYTALLDGYGNSGSVDCAFDVLKRMVDAGFKYHIDPAANGASISVADVWKILDLETALKLIGKMVELGCFRLISALMML